MRRSSSPQPSCECSIERDGACASVRVRGEVDLSTSSVVDARIRALRSAGFDRIELDLSEVTFMDSTGLHLVLRWTSEADRDGFAFSVSRCSPRARRSFELTHTSHLLNA